MSVKEKPSSRMTDKIKRKELEEANLISLQLTTKFENSSV